VSPASFYRQVQDEYRPLPRFALAGDGPPVSFDDCFADGEAEAGALFSLGGEEGVENLVPDLRADSRPVIGDSHLQSIPGNLSGDFNPAPGADGFETVLHEIVEHLVYQAVIDVDMRELRRPVEVELNPSNAGTACWRKPSKL